MTVFIIPTSPDPFYSQRTRLDGVDYLLSFSYNQRQDRIYFSLADDEENPIVSGIKVLANFPMLFRHRYDPRVPPGEFIAIDSMSDGTPPRLGELGEGLRCVLYYYDGAEVAAMRPPPPPPPVLTPIYIGIRIVEAPAYFGDSNYFAHFTTYVVSTCVAHFASSSSISAADIASFSGPYGTITGVSISLSPISTVPTSISTDVINLFANQTAFFSSSFIFLAVV